MHHTLMDVQDVLDAMTLKTHSIFSYLLRSTMKIQCLALAVVAGGAAAFGPQLSGHRASMQLYNAEVGAGGMADTRNPDAFEHEDPRKSISAAPSFEEYLKMRDGGAAAAAPAAPAPVAAAPVAAAPAAPSVGYGGSTKTSGVDGLASHHPRADKVAPVEKKELPLGFGGCTKTSDFDGLRSHHQRSDIKRTIATPEQVRSGVAINKVATPAQQRHFGRDSGGTILDDSKPYSYLGTKAGKRAELPIGFGGYTKTSTYDGLSSSRPRSDVARTSAANPSAPHDDAYGNDGLDDNSHHHLDHGSHGFNSEILYGSATGDPHAY